MELSTFCIIILFILFFMIFAYHVILSKNTVVGYQTIKEYNDIDYDLTKLNEKYHRKTCDDYCDLDICNQYEIDLDKYKKCLSCNRHFKCHNVFTDTCESCISLGINQCKMPINPKNKFCKN